MRLSAFMFLTDQTIGPAELAVALEDRGFHGLWVPEHPHIPTKRATPVPPAYGGGDLATFYLRLLDPFVALTAAASATTKLRVGTGVCLLALRDAVVTAKEVATLDFISHGRFDFGVGYGWNVDEFEDHGQQFADRHAVVGEKVELMRRLWGDDVATFTGQHASIQPSWAWPKPVARRAIPVFLGGNGPTTMREAAEWADYWYPTPSSPHLGDDIARFRAIVDETDRDAASVQVAVAAAPTDVDLIRACAEWGVAEISLALPSAGRDEVLPQLDQIVAVRADVLGES